MSQTFVIYSYRPQTLRISTLINLECVLQTSSGERSDIIAYLNCFAAGIFFATCLLHMIPEVSEQMKEIFETDYPLAECTVAIGFFFVLMLEQIVTRRGGGRV